MQQEIAAISTEYLRVRVIAKENGQLINPTTDVVEFGFSNIHVVNPNPTAWYAGSWETDGTKYYARCLVGPASVVNFLQQGETYNVWVKVHDTPETPAKLTGTVYIY